MHVYKGGSRDAAKGDHLIGWFSTPLASLVDGKRVRPGMLVPPRPPATPRDLARHAARRPPLQIKGTFPLLPPSKAAPYAPPGSTASPVAYSCRVGVDIRADPATEDFCLGGRVLSLNDVLVSRRPPPLPRLPALSD